MVSSVAMAAWPTEVIPVPARGRAAIGAVCSVDGCERTVHARGLCTSHYDRLLFGRPVDAPMIRRFDTPIRRFFAKVKVDPSGCWLWQGSMSRGYGKFGSRSQAAHLFAYELAHGPIPDGLVIDHLCRVTLCVHPLHLEAVTVRENTLRGLGPAAVNARKTHCIRGHEFTPENTAPHSDGGRRCRACRRKSA